MTRPEDIPHAGVTDEDQFPSEVWGSALELWAILSTNRKSDMRELADALLAERKRATEVERERCAGVMARLLNLAHPSSEAMSDFERINAFVRATHDADAAIHGLG